MTCPSSSLAPEAVTSLVQQYLTKASWKTSENANSTYSHQGLIQYVSTHIVSEYWLNHVYSEEVRQAVQENRFHIHDLGFLSAYCSGWSIEDILLQGFGGVENKIQYEPPCHFSTALHQTVNFLFTLQGELAGAQALSNFDTYLAPVIRHDGLSYDQVYKSVQSFVFSLNVPTRSGFQAPFTNISLDVICPKNLREQPVILQGKHHAEWTYGDFQEEMDALNRAFAEVMYQGDGNGNIFSFPIPTYNLYDGFDWDSPRFEPIWAMTAKYGVPYFTNFLNSDLNPEDFRSMCCRLRLDVGQLHSRGGSLFGSVPLTGSMGVVTLNMPNLAMRSDGTKESFLAIVDETLRVAKDSLETKRKVVNEHSALYPYAAHYLSAIKKRTGSYWTNHFSTIGVVGMNEALDVLFGEGIAVHREFALEVLEFIKQRLQEFQEETGNLYNLEATPAESTCYKLAQRDHEMYPHVSLPNFYTNSTMLPVDATDDLFAALDHQEPLHRTYTGGTVFHVLLGERLPSWTHARDLVRSIVTKYRIPYVSLTPTFSICKTHGHISGESHTCPKCGAECLVYSRIVGYFRPTRDWNRGKKEEFSLRKTYRYPGQASLTAEKRLCNGQLASALGELQLPIAGFIPQTFSDYPGKVQASIMFTSGCNLACPWCHNGPVVRGEADPDSPVVTPSEVLDHVTASAHKSLVVSGGEPTMHAGLVPFLRILRSHGISVKLDSNGTSPSVLRRVFAERLVDFVAMDIKAALPRYRKVAGRKVDVSLLAESISLIRESGVAHQFRTTLVPDLVDMEDLVECKRLAGGRLTVQKFRRGPTTLHRRFKDYKEHTDEEFAAMVARLAEVEV